MPSMLSMSGSIISMPLFMDMGGWGQFDGWAIATWLPCS
jgi:hypothetical protein